MSDKNPVLYHINGIPIRAKNKITMNYAEQEYVKIVRASISKGAAISEIVRIMCSPCTVCGNDKVTILLLPLSAKKKLSGRNIHNHHKRDTDEG